MNYLLERNSTRHLQLFNKNQSIGCIIDFMKRHDRRMIQLLKYGNLTFDILFRDYLSPDYLCGVLFTRVFLHATFDDRETTTTEFSAYLVVLLDLFPPFDLVNVISWCCYGRERDK